MQRFVLDFNHFIGHFYLHLINTIIIFLSLENKKKNPINKLNAVTVSSASEGSSSICSTNGLNDRTKASPSWASISGISDAHFVHSLQNVGHNEQLSDDLIGDVITNDMIIINGADLDQSDNEMIANCNFDKTNGQTTIDSYFVDQETQQHQHHLPDANDSILIESNLSNLSNAILNDSSNEVNNNNNKMHHLLWSFMD